MAKRKKTYNKKNRKTGTNRKLPNLIENIDLIKNKKQIDENIIKKEFTVIDARSRGRFEGFRT